jgi:hypothetical protein
MKTEESALKAKYRAHLKELGAYRFSPVQMGYGMPTLDDLACLHGRFIGLEAKASGKKPTPRQIQIIKDIQTAGGVAFWFDSYDGYLLNMRVQGFIP